MPRSPLLNVMVTAVLKAGRGLKRDFGELENLQVSAKGPANFVSNADRKAEQSLHDDLAKARPGYGFLMEEGGEIQGSDHTHRWIIDPLDGTTNFLHGLPLFCVSLGLERDGVPVAGVIYNPATDDLFLAERGQGAFLNDRRIRVSGRRAMDEALICAGIAHLGHGHHILNQQDLAATMGHVAGNRHLGSAALELAYVAAGRFDGSWERWLKPWDMAAGIVLIREAGGFVTDARGGETMLEAGEVVTGNEFIHRGLLGLLSKA